MTKRVGLWEGGQAFPTEGGEMSGCHAHTGMTLREYYAGQAIVGLLAAGGNDGAVWNAFAEEAFAIADAMLARARKERDEEEQAERDAYDATTPAY